MYFSQEPISRFGFLGFLASRLSNFHPTLHPIHEPSPLPLAEKFELEFKRQDHI